MKSWKLIGLFRGHRPFRFAEECVDEQTAAHADATMNAPNRELNADPFQRLAPSQNVLVNAVHQSAVEIKQESWSGAGDLHFRTPGIFWVEGVTR